MYHQKYMEYLQEMQERNTPEPRIIDVKIIFHQGITYTGFFQEISSDKPFQLRVLNQTVHGDADAYEQFLICYDESPDVLALEITNEAIQVFDIPNNGSYININFAHDNVLVPGYYIGGVMQLLDEFERFLPRSDRVNKKLNCSTDSRGKI